MVSLRRRRRRSRLGVRHNTPTALRLPDLQGEAELCSPGPLLDFAYLRCLPQPLDPQTAPNRRAASPVLGARFQRSALKGGPFSASQNEIAANANCDKPCGPGCAVRKVNIAAAQCTRAQALDLAWR